MENFLKYVIKNHVSKLIILFLQLQNIFPIREQKQYILFTAYRKNALKKLFFPRLCATFNTDCAENRCMLCTAACYTVQCTIYSYIGRGIYTYRFILCNFIQFIL